MTDRDKQRLSGVHPTLIAKLDHILTVMAATGHTMMVVQGLRTAQEQRTLYAKGRTTPGPNARPGKPLGDVVTMKDGIVHKSNHQARTDGLGHAVDCAFAGVPDPFADHHPWEQYGKLAETAGLRWGGRWSHPHDSPHVELA
jgi:peptidoglycan L-alanyl-D-glutamate endopeptidase CwlK